MEERKVLKGNEMNRRSLLPILALTTFMLLLMGCGRSSDVPAQVVTPGIEATVEVRVEEDLEERPKQEITRVVDEDVVTATPTVTPTATPSPTATLVPTFFPMTVEWEVVTVRIPDDDAILMGYQEKSLPMTIVYTLSVITNPNDYYGEFGRVHHVELPRLALVAFDQAGLGYFDTTRPGVPIHYLYPGLSEYVTSIKGIVRPNDKYANLGTEIFSGDTEVPHEWRARRFLGDNNPQSGDVSKLNVPDRMEWIASEIRNAGSTTGGEIIDGVGTLIKHPLQNVEFDVDGDWIINSSDIQWEYSYTCTTTKSLDDKISLMFSGGGRRATEGSRFPPLPESLRPDFKLLRKYPEIKSIRSTHVGSGRWTLSPNTKIQAGDLSSKLDLLGDKTFPPAAHEPPFLLSCQLRSHH